MLIIGLIHLDLIVLFQPQRLELMKIPWIYLIIVIVETWISDIFLEKKRPDRLNIILTRNPDFLLPDDCLKCSSLEEAFEEGFFRRGPIRYVDSYADYFGTDGIEGQRETQAYHL